MKIFICVAVLVITVLEAVPVKKHNKRFAGFNVAGIGGSAGCVVTGNKLFANGFFLRELTTEEQRELEQYEEESKKYKEEVKTSLEEKRKEWQLRHKKGGKAISSLSQKDLPKPPKKPSFCSAADTTQYYFDGCMVQNDKVYVGREYARDLTPEEIKELKEFDVKMTAYQKYLASSIQQQVDSLFGGKTDFWSLFTDPHHHEASTTTEVVTSPTTTPEPVEAPQAPNFCIAIY